MQKKTLILAQAFISGAMACLMSGAMSWINLGLDMALQVWFRSFLLAWPIAFVLSLAVGPVAFWLAGRLTRPRFDAAPS